MQRWRGLEAAPSDWGRCVATIGVFDGVHRGHQVIIGHAVARACDLGLPAVVVTFDPHPSEVVRPGSHPAVLTSPRHKAALLEALGVDVTCVLPFTQEFSQLRADAFVHAVLVEHLHAAAVVVGENFRFGHGAAGDLALLAGLGRRFGFGTEGVPLVVVPGDGPGQVAGSEAINYSSTNIRNLIAAGDVGAAGRMLGRPHRVEGVVVRGDARGRTIGFPTANLEPPPHSAVPGDGIYAGWLARGDERLPAAISIGSNPTFEGTERRVEAFVLDADIDLYGDHVALDFAVRLRGIERFDSVEALVAQMHRDAADTRAALSASRTSWLSEG